MKLIFKSIYILGIVLATSLSVQAASSDVFITETDVRLTPADPIASQTFRIYTTVRVSGDTDEVGTVKFWDETTSSSIGTEQPFSAVANGTDTVFLDWKLDQKGKHTISVRVIPWGDDTNINNNRTRRTFTVDSDFDGDEIGDLHDSDMDNDGVENPEDAFPKNKSEWYDTDRDGLGDNSDPDIDGDGLSNDVEKITGTNPHKYDSDGDGCGDARDEFPGDPNECEDTDHDGIGDNSDPDIDGDGVDNITEKQIGSDPKNRDTDGDSFADGEDEFPVDPDEWFDSDHDRIGDNSDPLNNDAEMVYINDKPGLIANAGDEIHFDIASAINTNIQAQTINWEFGDGDKSNQKQVSHIYEIPGSYQITLTVIGNNDVVSKTIIDLEILESKLGYYLTLTFLIIVFFSAGYILLRKKPSASVRHHRK